MINDIPYKGVNQIQGLSSSVWCGIVMDKQDFFGQNAAVFVLDCSSELFHYFTVCLCVSQEKP